MCCVIQTCKQNKILLNGFFLTRNVIKANQLRSTATFRIQTANCVKFNEVVHQFEPTQRSMNPVQNRERCNSKKHLFN